MKSRIPCMNNSISVLFLSTYNNKQTSNRSNKRKRWRAHNNRFFLFFSLCQTLNTYFRIIWLTIRMQFGLFFYCVCVCSLMKIYKQAQVERRRKKNVLCFTLWWRTKKKHSSIARRRNNLLLRLLLFYWIAFSFSRSLVDEPARENEKGKKNCKLNNDEVRRERWCEEEKKNQPTK